MSRTYRRKQRSIETGWFVHSENEFLVGGYIHRWTIIEPTEDYRIYRAREVAQYHADGLKTFMGVAPGWFCNMYNRQERRASKQQIRHGLKGDYENVDVYLVNGPHSATWDWW